MTYKQFIEEPNVSMAWAKSLEAAYGIKKQEVVPLVVSVTGFDASNDVIEEPTIRQALDTFLSASGKQSVETVANTIFPQSIWNPAAPRALLFQRYNKIFPRIKKSSPKNNYGIYFNRMIAGGNSENPNQLDYIIEAYLDRTGVRRSLLQVATFIPELDHTTAAQRGFPCLQHVTFSPTKVGLSVNAFYASQFMVEKAYGNYIGLCRLGKFVAHEFGLKLARVTCYTGVSTADAGVAEVAPIRAAYNAVIAAQQGTP